MTFDGTKVAVIGAGRVGSTLAYTLVVRANPEGLLLIATNPVDARNVIGGVT